MAKTTHPLRTKAQGKEETRQPDSRGILKTLGRLTRPSSSKRAGYLRVGTVALTSCLWLAGGSSTIALTI